VTGFDAFCTDEYPRLVGTLTLFCGDQGVAEELTQETLVRAYQHWKRVQRLDNPGAWANRVALNLATSHYRRKRAERRAHERLDRASSHEQIVPEPESNAPELRAALARLSRKQRSALILRHYVGLSVAEVAHHMNCPEGTVKRLTHEAIRSLRHSPALDQFREVVRDGT
jgi:RNA polymerase sigma-70 factor (sigma-E family)